MSTRRWANVSYLDAIRPEPGWRTEYAFLASYSADLVALVAALLALAGLDDDRGSGSKVDFANAVDQLADRVRLVAQAGRLVAPPKTPKILAILDRYIREVDLDESVASWHPKAALAKQLADDGKTSQWRLWIGSRNLTRDLSWDIGLTLIGRVDGSGTEIPGIPELGHTLAQHARLPGLSPGTVRSELRQVRWDAPPGCTLNPVDLEQREGRIQRFGGLSIRRAIAESLAQEAMTDRVDGESPWTRIESMANERMCDDSGLAPWWVCKNGTVTRYVFDVPTSEQKHWLHWMKEQRLLYRLALGHPNQEDLVELLSSKVGMDPESVRQAVVNLSPWFRDHPRQ